MDEKVDVKPDVGVVFVVLRSVIEVATNSDTDDMPVGSCVTVRESCVLVINTIVGTFADEI